MTTVAELQAVMQMDDTAFQQAADRVEARLKSLQEQADALRLALTD